MIPLTLAEVAGIVDGHLDAVADAHLAVTETPVVDSRSVTAGSLFVAVVGEHVDGHDFAAAAVDSGAVAVLAARPVGVPAIVVDDVVVALGRLARGVLDRLPEVRVTGVTGSAGKTSTKDLLAQLLGPDAETIAPVGSFNNEIGLPLTVLRATETTRHLVLEYSARGVGHIAYLCTVAPPRVGVELNVGSAHLGEFGSADAIAEAKGELVEALPADGVAVLNADDERVAAMRRRTRARVVTYGVAHPADLRAADVQLDTGGRPSYRLESADGSAPVTMQLVGAHHVSNALAAAAAAAELGVPLDEIARRLSSAGPRSRWRMEVEERGDGVTVVNDAYNANPESMAAALRATVAIAGGRRRAWAVLGAMHELGIEAAAAHAEVARLARSLGVHEVVAVAAPAYGARDVPDVEGALALLRDELRPGDVVLVKASRAAGLERLAAALLGDRAEVRA